MSDADRERHGTVTRRRFLASLVLVGGTALVVACQAVPSPSSSTASTAVPATAAPAATTAAVSTTAGAAGAASDWQQSWQDLQTAAGPEGKVVVSGPPTPQLKTTLPAAFNARFGLQMDYTGEAISATRLVTERAGSVYSTDVVIAGAGSMFQSIAGGGDVSNGVMGMLAPLRSELILPEVVTPSYYRDDRIWFVDPQDAYVYRMISFTHHSISINTDVVKPTDITSWYDLLKPEYTGKIATYDPSVNGSAVGDTVNIYERLGADYIKKLFVDQNPFIARDPQQLANMLGQGTYPIALFLEEQALSDLIKQGLPVTKLPPPSGVPETVTGGFGFAGLLDHAPHPNAAKVFVNWLLSREGQQIFQDAQLQVSRRNDLDISTYPDWFPDTIPQPGHDYFDIHDWSFALDVQPGVQKDLKSLLQRV